ncbi:cytochrome P450 9e2-like [Leptopilina heterotoma]|uniref:cytochrome P450 9e2-like n=1 Tax=Leptopilina heterotoma TaxID=63436 RepID=UPI001CA8C68B|nr:cytochrome P450 9e2-like [Leptopilina heterotoma]
MSFWNTIFLFFICCFIIYVYFQNQMNLFKKAGIPHLKPWPIVGNFLPILLKKTTIAEFIMNLYNLNPNAKYVGFYEYGRPIILLRDPEIMKLVAMKREIFPNRRGFDLGNNDSVMGKELFSAKYEKWQEMRKTVSPAFTPRKLKMTMSIISQKTKIFLDHILQLNEAVEIDTLKWIQKYIIDFTHANTYGIETTTVTDNTEDFYNFCFDAANLEKIEKRKQFQLMSSFLWNIFKMSYIDDKVLEYFRNIVKHSIARRKNENYLPETIIDLIIDSSIHNKKTIEELTAEVYLLFAAAFDSTSSTLTYFCYYLAVNNHIQEKIREEIFSLQENVKRTNTTFKETSNHKFSDVDLNSFQPTLEDLDNLKYLDATIKETLRVHSLLPVERESVTNFQLPPALPGLKSFTIEAGTLVLIPIEPVCKDPQYFEEPDKFKPERFFDEKNFVSTLAFGVGHRKCIGNRLVPLLVKLFTYHTLIRCNIRTCEKTPIPLNVSNNKFTKTPEKKIWLRIEKRKVQGDEI